MPDGVIVGGWGYVIAAYALTAGGLLGYALTLGARLRASRDKDGER